MPENQRRILVVGRDLRLVHRAACTWRSRLHHRWPIGRGSIGEHRRARLLLLRILDPEVDSREILGPSRRAVRADHHRARHAGGLRIDDGLGGARNVRESNERIERILRDAVRNAAENGERRSAVGPREPAIQTALAVERLHDVRLHVAQLDTVAESVARVDGVGEEFAGVVECELTDVADVHHLAGGEIVEQKIGAFDTRRRGGTSCWCTSRSAAFSRIRLHREPTGLFTGEGEATHLVELLLLARRDVHECQLVVQRPALRLETLRFLRCRIDAEGHELRRRRDDQRRSSRCGTRGTSHRRGRLTDLKAMLLALARGPQHHLGIAIVRRKLVGEPVAVIGQRLTADVLPRLDVGGGERTGGCCALDAASGARSRTAASRACFDISGCLGTTYLEVDPSESRGGAAIGNNRGAEDQPKSTHG